MRRILSVIAFLSINLYATAQFSQNEDRQIIIGTVDSLFSEILNEQREIWVHAPEDIDDSKKHPVIYLLNSPGHFYTATGILNLLEKWSIPNPLL